MRAAQTKEKVELRVFMTSARANYDAIGVFDGKGITILKNSIVSPTVTHERLDADKRAEMLTEGGALKEDTYFKSPSAAALFVCGRSANGWVEWKTVSGETLQSVREEKEAEQAASVKPATTVDIPRFAPKGNKQERRLRKRLIARIKKEFDKKFFIGDIAISDQEYEILIQESKYILAVLMRSNHVAAESVSLAVALVQIGIRKYDGRHFWPYVEEELGVERNLKHQALLGETFINTLRKHGKYITDASERVQNILFHGFVSNYYSKGLFELLFQYYAKDLERDIYRNTTEQMQALMDTLAKKAAQGEKEGEAFADQFMAKGSRAYKLRSHTLQAISAHPIHSRTRLRRLLRLIDRSFWNNAVPKNPTSRLTILFKEWVEDSSAYKKEYRLYQLGEIRNRGKKHFSTPYLFAHIGAGSFELKLPAQIVAEEYAEGLEWEIFTNARTFRISADTYPVLTGYKTEECKATVSQREIFGSIQCQLVCEDYIVRKFPHLPESTVRFFDMEGDYAPRLFKIPMCAYTPADCTLHSSALISKVPHGSMTRWDFEFQQGDLVILPDGTGMIVGDHYTEGLVPRGQVTCADYVAENGGKVPVYASAPELLLTIPKGKLPGTVLYCNDVPYRLADCGYTEFENRDTRGVQAILLPLTQFDFCKDDGVKTIILDAPGTHYDKAYSFVLIKGLAVEFSGAPYVFEERGAVLFPTHIKVSGTYEKLQGENGYQFALRGNEPRLNLTVNGNLSLAFHIPVLSWSVDKENWNVLPAGELWHTEFFEIRKLYLRSPIGKISIFTDADIDDDDDDNHIITAEAGADGVYTIDMTRFRSWLTREVMKNDIILKMGGNEYTFATVFTKSLVSSYDVSADYEEGTLTWLSDIIGKADYYLDIVHLETGAILAEKKQLKDGKLVLQDRLRSGLYKFTLYEAEDDDSGFDDPIYEELLYTERKLTNRNDASGQFLEIRSFKLAQGSNLYTAFQKKYYVASFEKVDTNLYEGRLFSNGIDTGLKVTIEFLKPGDMRFFHVSAWHAEEECDVDLLYDRDQGSLELDQMSGLRSSESYRRYRELSYGEFIYFGILHDKQPAYQLTVAEPTKLAGLSETKQYSRKEATPIEQLGLSVRSYNCLKRAGLRYVGDLIKLPGDQWLRIRNMGKNSVAEIAVAVSKLGLAIKSPDYRVAEQIPPSTSVESTPMLVATPAPVAEKIKSVAEETQEENDNRNIPLSELGFPQHIYFALLQSGVETAGDVADLTPFAWKQMKQLKPKDQTLVHAKMKELGLRIKK